VRSSRLAQKQLTIRAKHGAELAEEPAARSLQQVQPSYGVVKGTGKGGSSVPKTCAKCLVKDGKLVPKKGHRCPYASEKLLAHEKADARKKKNKGVPAA
jgi:hypothetical protein